MNMAHIILRTQLLLCILYFIIDSKERDQDRGISKAAQNMDSGRHLQIDIL